MSDDATELESLLQYFSQESEKGFGFEARPTWGRIELVSKLLSLRHIPLPRMRKIRRTARIKKKSRVRGPGCSFPDAIISAKERALHQGKGSVLRPLNS